MRTGRRGSIDYMAVAVRVLVSPVSIVVVVPALCLLTIGVRVEEKAGEGGSVESAVSLVVRAC